jgi:hypothetical protein
MDETYDVLVVLNRLYPPPPPHPQVTLRPVCSHVHIYYLSPRLSFLCAAATACQKCAT